MIVTLSPRDAMAVAVVLTLLWLILTIQEGVSKSPHIIFILADDLGWNDVGFHGSNQIPTPNIDSLAYTGVILRNYYVAPVCTPSRGALMTGKYPIHIGLQHSVIHAYEPYGLNLSEVILPQLLKNRGYTTRAIGKWHLGNYKKEYTPESRGFDSHYGYWTGHQDYYDHTAHEKMNYWGYDMRRGMNISWLDFGKYTTDLLTAEATAVIDNHDTSTPLFLYFAHLATHSANPYMPLQAPRERVAQFNYIENEDRRIFAAMLSKMDDSVGAVVTALSKKKMLRDSVIIFSTDNGGPAAGFDNNVASNWPLRGVKDTMWEGGVRGAAFIWSTKLQPRVSNELMHISDWLPTILDATEVRSAEDSKDIDGLSQWQTLLNQGASPREDVLLNIDRNRSVAGYIKKDWKLLKGNTWNGDWNSWYGPDGRENEYPWVKLYSSPVAQAIELIIPLPPQKEIEDTLKKCQFDCVPPTEIPKKEEKYLFNLNSDPCELTNMVSARPDIVADLEEDIKRYENSAKPPLNQDLDPQSNPKYWGYAWINWKDFNFV